MKSTFKYASTMQVTRKLRLISMFLLLCMAITFAPNLALPALADEGESMTLSEKEDAMEAILSNDGLLAAQQGTTATLAADGYIGIPVALSVFYDAATHGAATPGYLTEGATPVIVYTANTNTERIGTDSDESILSSMLARGYIVVVLDYQNHEKAVSPDLDWSVQKLRNEIVKGNHFNSLESIPSGNYVDTYVVPAGYDILLNDVFFELDKHGTDGTLEKIVNVWNNDFRRYKSDTIVKWVHEDGTRKTVQNGFDGSSPVWYADAAGKTVDSANGTYTKIEYTKAEVITDCVQADGTPIDLNLYFTMIYPTKPAQDVPVMSIYSSTEYLADCISKDDRPQFMGFLFSGYAGVMFDYGMMPMGRTDHYGYFDGNSGDKSITGDNMTYSAMTFNTAQITTAAMRYIRYLSKSDHSTYCLDEDAIGIYGISKAGWMTHLGAPELRENLYTPENGMTESEIAELVNDKINGFYQLWVLPGYSGESRYDKGITTSYTKDGFTVDGGTLQPWLTYGGYEIASGAQMIYSSCGASLDHLKECYSPLFITVNLNDTANTQYGQQNKMVALCRMLDLPALWYEAEIAHTFAVGTDANHGVDIYDAFFKFADYYLKNAPVSVSYTEPKNGSIVSVGDGLTVKFIGQVSATEIEKARITDASGGVVFGTWSSAYGNTEWTFLPYDMKGDTQYTLTFPSNMLGENGTAMGVDYTASFYTHPETITPLSIAENATVSTGGTAVLVTVPELNADGYRLRVRVDNVAANMLEAYDIDTNICIGCVRVSGAGFYEIDISDYIAEFAEGTELSILLKTQSVGTNALVYEQDFNTNSGGFTCSSYSQMTTGVAIDGALALKVIGMPNAGKYSGDHAYYPNTENAYTLNKYKVVNNGTRKLTAEDIGRTYQISFRIYDTVSRPILFWMNSPTSKNDKLVEFEGRCYYTAQTRANEWCEISFTYTVYESDYGWNDYYQSLYVHIAPTNQGAGQPIYFDHFSVEEVLSDLSVGAVSLVGDFSSGKTLQKPIGSHNFSVSGVTYASWKTAINAATDGSVITLLRNYTLTDTELADLGAKTELTIDLNGYRLWANNTQKAPLWVSATSAENTTLTLKNGTVVLSDTPLVSYDNSVVAGSGKTINVQCEDLYITAVDHALTRNIISAATITAGVQLTVNATLTDTVIDLTRDQLSQLSVSLFSVGNEDLNVNYSFVGGRLKMDRINDIAFCDAIIKASANAEGEYFKAYISQGDVESKMSFKQGTDYASLIPTGRVKGYEVYALEAAANSTPYGVVPNENENNVFVLFRDEKFIKGVDTWKDACTAARETLNAYPGSHIDILLQKDDTPATYIGNSNWLCFMNGSILLDLGGNTLTSSASLFEAGVDKTYTGSYDTALTVKNGTVLVGGGNICGAQNNSNYDKKIDVTFENVTFGIDTATFATKRNTLFYGQKDNASYSGCLELNLTLNNCTLDLRNIPVSYTVFSYSSTNVAVAVDIALNGGMILVDSFNHITWLTLDSSNDTFTWGKGSDGQYTKLTQPVSNLLPSIDGINAAGDYVSFGNGITDGDSTVYTLIATPLSDLETAYGTIPVSAASAAVYPFVLFTEEKALIEAVAGWYELLTAANTYLASNPGETVYAVMRRDFENTRYFKSIGVLNGTLEIDLGGFDMVRKSGSLIEAGTNGLTEAQCAYITTVNLKNGRILAMNPDTSNNGHIIAYQAYVNYNKTINFTFDNVIFAVSSAASTTKDLYSVLCRCNAVANNATGVICSALTLRNCSFDFTGSEGTTVPATAVRVISTSGGGTSHQIAIAFEGGTVKGSLGSMIFTDIGSYDTVTYLPDADGNYLSYCLISGMPSDATVSTDQGKAFFETDRSETLNGVTWTTYLLNIARDPDIMAANLILSNDIAIRYYVLQSRLEGYTDYYLKALFMGKEYTLRADAETKTINGAEYTVFTFAHIAPSKLGEAVTVTLYSSMDGESYIKSDPLAYGVTDYCYNMLAKETTSTALKKVIVDLLNYGSDAQKYTGYNTDALANSALTEDQQVLGTTTAPTLQNHASVSESGDNIAEWLAASLYLESSVTVKFYFTAEDVSNLTASVDFDGVAPWTTSDFKHTTLEGVECYYIEFNAMKASELKNILTVTLSNGTQTSAVLTYSVESYAYAKQNSENTALADLVVSMMKYIDSVDEYVNSNN